MNFLASPITCVSLTSNWGWTTFHVYEQQYLLWRACSNILPIFLLGCLLIGLVGDLYVSQNQACCCCLFVLLILFSNTSWLAFYFLRIFQCTMVPDFNVLCMGSLLMVMSIVSWCSPSGDHEAVFWCHFLKAFIVMFSTLKSVTRSSFLCVGWGSKSSLFIADGCSVDPGFSASVMPT